MSPSPLKKSILKKRTISLQSEPSFEEDDKFVTDSDMRSSEDENDNPASKFNNVTKQINAPLDLNNSQ